MKKTFPSFGDSEIPRSNDERPAFLHGGVTDRVIAAAIAVHKALGPGYLESIYEEAFSLELDRAQISHERQVPRRIRYLGVAVGMHRLDVVVDGKVIVELKAVKQIDDAHIAVMLSYLKSADLNVGLIINFAEPMIRVRRVVRGAGKFTAEGMESQKRGKDFDTVKP